MTELINGVINWKRLVFALAFYRTRGYLECDLEWHAPRDICYLTCSDPNRMYDFDDNVLVGSAEQSFMAALKSGTLRAGRYVSLTPCFRREQEVTETHKRTFMKVELFAADIAGEEVALQFARDAMDFMSTQTDEKIDLVKTAEGYDLEIGGIEVGSYSARELGGMKWTCGTGLAEPRFTTAVLNAEAGITPREKSA